MTALPEAVSTTEAAEIVGLAPATLETLRCRGGGPPYYKIGRRVVYRSADLRAWVDSKRVMNTAQVPA